MKGRERRRTDCQVTGEAGKGMQDMGGRRSVSGFSIQCNRAAKTQTGGRAGGERERLRPGSPWRPPWREPARPRRPRRCRW